MKLASLKNGRRDGELVVVSRDLLAAVRVADIAATLHEALDQWETCQPRLRDVYGALNEGKIPGAFAFDAATTMAPLPRAPQWCDGSAFINHARLMEVAFNTPPIPELDTTPIMYQGASDDFLGAHDDIVLPDEAHGIDFEGEFGVIVDDVPMACSAEDALARVRLVVQINDVSLRAFGRHEMLTGFGFLNAKPSSSFAPVAVTPDELGDAWRDGRVHLDLHIDWNGAWFGHPNGGAMHFGFGQLIAHAARTRRLSAGTIIGSGTVSNADRAAGSGCISERRAIEMIDRGSISTPFMRFGDTVGMEARMPSGAPLFGAIRQRIVQSDRYNQTLTREPS